MQEKIKAYLRDWDKPPSLDNIDFDTSIHLKNIREQGHRFEFGRYDRRDGSVEITLELPDPAHVPAQGSPEEWEQQREWYLKHSGNSAKTLRRGIAEGYILEEDCMGLVNAAEIMQMELKWRDMEFFYECLMSKMSWDEITYEFGEEEDSEAVERKRNIRTAKAYLEDGKNLTYRSIIDAKRLRNNILEGKPWTNHEFKKIGFKFPEFSNQARENVYVLDTLDEFLGIVDKLPRHIPRTELKHLVKLSKLDYSIIQEFKNEPWQVYEAIKEAYCSRADSSQEYNLRIEEVVFALGV